MLVVCGVWHNPDFCVFLDVVVWFGVLFFGYCLELHVLGLPSFCSFVICFPGVS